MHPKRSTAVALAVAMVGLLGALAIPQASADHFPAYDVGVGQVLQTAPGESMRFLAPEMNVHQGSVVNFVGEFHTATLLPAGQDPDEWIAANVLGSDAPYGVVTADPDEEGIKYNPALWFPSSSDCGVGDAPACHYTGSSVVNSGVLAFSGNSWAAEIDVQPGMSFWVICLLHPAMRMKINVVENGSETTTQEAIDAFEQQAVAADEAEASALHREFSTKRESRRIGNGKREWTAWGGIDTDNVSLFDFYPQRLKIKRGDRVRWTFDDLKIETHTVTLPKARALQIVNRDFQFVCDPDGDEGSQADTPAEPPPGGGPPVVCPEGSTLEIDAAPEISPGQLGNGVWRGPKDLEHSGIRGALAPPPSSPYAVRFKKVTGKKGVVYICVIHPFMQSKVVVKRP